MKENKKIWFILEEIYFFRGNQPRSNSIITKENRMQPTQNDVQQRPRTHNLQKPFCISPCFIDHSTAWHMAKLSK